MDADCSSGGGGGGSACAGGWALCPQPRAWRPTRGQPPPPPGLRAQSRGGRRARLPAPSGGPAPASASSLPASFSFCLLSLSQAPRPPPLWRCHRQFPDHCGTAVEPRSQLLRPRPPLPPASLGPPLWANPSWEPSRDRGRGRGEGGRIPDSEGVTQPQWASQPTKQSRIPSPPQQHNLRGTQGSSPIWEEVCAVSWDPVCL